VREEKHPRFDQPRRDERSGADTDLPISRLAFCAARLAGGVRSVRRNLCALRRDGAAQESLGQGVNNPQQIANRCVSEVKQNPRQ
jgi:hypothetical protein